MMVPAPASLVLTLALLSSLADGFTPIKPATVTTATIMGRERSATPTLVAAAKTDAEPLPSLSPTNPIEMAMRVTRDIISPVFLSIDPATKEVVRGLGGVPGKDQPVVMAGNHQMFGLDGVTIVEEFIREREQLVKALVYPVLLEEESPLAPLPYPLPGTPQMLKRFGALPAGGMNMLRLLKKGSSVLIFPGGAREVFKRKNEAYTLQWPRTPELVRLAASVNATIVPFAAVGGDEFFSDPVLDTDDLLGLPFIGSWLQERTGKLPSLVKGDSFVPPIVLPRPEGPRRHYFLFLDPIDTTDLDPKDVRGCNEVYSQLRTAVEDGLEYLQVARESDPNEAAVPRMAVERVTGRQQPSFDFDSASRRTVRSSWVPRPTDEVCVLVADDMPPLCVESQKRWD